jgi:preprotein translocase subunit SecE
MKKIKLYLQDSYNELMHKVSWPTFAELQSSAIVVMVASFLIGIVVFLMDSIFQGSMNLLYNMFA